MSPVILCYKCNKNPERTTTAKRKVKKTLCVQCKEQSKKISSQKYKIKNCEKIRAQSKIYRSKNLKKRNEYNRLWHKKNKTVKSKAQCTLTPREKRKIYYRNSYSKPEYREKAIERAKKRAIEKKEEVNKYKKTWHDRKLKSDRLYALKIKLRRRVFMAFKAALIDKRIKTSVLLGADWKEVFVFIENKFKAGMSWDNHGKWHIDHIIPLCSAKTESELIHLLHYTNLQPLWAQENYSKGGKIQ